MIVPRSSVLLFFCLTFASGSALTGCSAEPTTPTPASPPTPQVTLETADEHDYQRLLERHRGKIILVDFWATWCTPCVEQFPHTVEMHHKYQPQGLAVISMSFDDESARNDALSFLEEKGATFDNLISKYGTDPKSFDLFDIDGGAVPHYKLYDRGGKLVKKFVIDPAADPIEPEDIELAIRELIAKPAASGG
jgi:thiol-disulfide isomerase/thioredoxin